MTARAPTSSSSSAARKPRTDPKIGDRIGPYEVREEIGRGSFAIVYRGENLVRGRGIGAF